MTDIEGVILGSGLVDGHDFKTLTTAELDQIRNIDANTITNADWALLGNHDSTTGQTITFDYNAVTGGAVNVQWEIFGDQVFLQIATHTVATAAADVFTSAAFPAAIRPATTKNVGGVHIGEDDGNACFLHASMSNLGVLTISKNISAGNFSAAAANKGWGGTITLHYSVVDP